jgi:hypothetical protein
MFDGSSDQLWIDGSPDVLKPEERRSVRMRAFLLPFILALGIAGVTASSAWAAKAPPTVECASSSTLAVTWTFSEFPNADNNTIKETIKVDGVFSYKGEFKFNGPSGTNTVTISIAPGPHEIGVHAGWATNGVSGESDRKFLVECSVVTPSAPRTPGYWKNHLSSGSPNTQQYLPQSIGNYQVDTTEQASAIFVAMNCASWTSQNAIGCLAGQLLASELNLANGSPSCIAPVVATANSWLAGNTEDGVPGVLYAGPSANYTLTQAQRNEAIALKKQLARYNRKGECL